MKVKVRIAVAVDAKGTWGCAGWTSKSKTYDKDALSLAAEGVDQGEAHYWLEAELDVPEATTVQANVEPA